MRSFEDYAEKNRELSVMRVNLVAMLDRTTALQERASSVVDAKKQTPWRKDLSRRQREFFLILESLDMGAESEGGAYSPIVSRIDKD